MMARVSRSPIETARTIDTTDWTAVVPACYPQLGSRVPYKNGPGDACNVNRGLNTKERYLRHV